MRGGRPGLWNGAFYREPRPIWLSNMHGLRASVAARPLVQKALGLWDWEARPSLESTLHRNPHTAASFLRS